MINHYKYRCLNSKYIYVPTTLGCTEADDNSDTDEGPTHGAEDSEGQQGLSTLEITGDCVKRVNVICKNLFQDTLRLYIGPMIIKQQLFA